MNYKILVVDDDKKTVELIRLSLKNEHFETLEAYDGIEALALTRSEAPDLIILDWLLPHIGGLDLCRIIRAESTIPVILLTARATEEDKLLGLNLGADDYLTKPFSLRELVARVRIVLRRTYQSAERPATLHAGNLVIDLQAHEVWLSGKPVRSNSWKRLPPLLAGHLAARNWWSASTVWIMMALTAPLTFTWGTCVRKSMPILSTIP